MMGQDPNDPRRNPRRDEQAQQYSQHESSQVRSHHAHHSSTADSSAGQPPPTDDTSTVSSQYVQPSLQHQQSYPFVQQQQNPEEQYYQPQQYQSSRQWWDSQSLESSPLHHKRSYPEFPDPIVEHSEHRNPTQPRISGSSLTSANVDPPQQRSHAFAQAQYSPGTYMRSEPAQSGSGALSLAVTQGYQTTQQKEFERSHQMTTLTVGSQWHPRAASAPSPSLPPPTIPMFGERLQQRATSQKIPHIPNIVVEPVPSRDIFGHSRTPPFVQSEWKTSKWGLSVPSSSKKMRTNSDSAIYEAEKEHHHQQLSSRSSSGFPTSWEMLAFRQSQISADEESYQEHIKSGEGKCISAEFTSSAGTESLPYQTHPRSSAFQYQNVTAEPKSSNIVAMETDISQGNSPADEEREEESMEALNLKRNISPTEEESSALSKFEDVSSKASKPTVPFIWKFQTSKTGHSPKMYWLRRHSDSNVPVEPEDLSVPKELTSHSLSISESSAQPETTSADTGIESGGATGSSTSGAEGGDIPSPREHGGDLLSKRLKLKKYLQKRYQLSLESTSRHSTESDDVFSPSPGIFGSSQGFSFSPTLVEGDITPRHTKPSPLASSLHASHSSPTTRASITFAEPLEIKTEPISPVSSESEGEGETGVFLSPASFSSPKSASSPHTQTSVFQFHSPTSYHSQSYESLGEKSPYSEAQPRLCDSEEMLTVGPHVFVTEESKSEQDTSFQTPPREAPRMEIIRHGRLPPLASMLSHPSFTHPNPNVPSFTAPPTPPFLTYQRTSSPQAKSKHGASSSSAASAKSSSSATTRVRSVSDSDKPVDPSKIIYCPFSEKVQEQRYQREMTFLCPVCGQMFPSYNYLANHMVNHLPSEVVAKGPGDSNKVHLCKVCNRSFSRSDMLTRHMRLHTGLRPYECRMCGQVFSRSDHLHTHLRTHTGEKPYRCPQCPYAAPRRDMITRHMRIHTKHFSRRGRRSSSTSSVEPQSSSFSSLESGDSERKKRNQSLSSVGSEGSVEASVLKSKDILDAEVGRSRHWSVTSGESMESSADCPLSTPSSKYSRTWSLTSIESVETPASASPPVPGQATPPAPTVSTPSSSSTLTPTHHRAHRTLSAASAESGGTEDSRATPITMELSQEHVSIASDQGDTEMQTSFQKCQVTSDKESSGSDMSPAAAETHHG